MVWLPKIKYYLCIRMYVCILSCMSVCMCVCQCVCMYASTHILYVRKGLHVCRYHVCKYIKYVDMAEH